MTTSDAKTTINGVKEPVDSSFHLTEERKSKDTTVLLNGSHSPVATLSINGVCGSADDDHVNVNGSLNGHSASPHSSDLQSDSISGL